MPIRPKDLAAPSNSHIALNGSAILGQAFAQLDTKGGDLSWHLVVARSDGTWAAIKFRELSLKASDDPSKMDTPLEELEWLITAKEVRQDRMGTGLAKDLAGKSPGELIVVTDHERRLIGILYVGAKAAPGEPVEIPQQLDEPELTEDVLVSKPRVLNSNFTHPEDPSQLLEPNDALIAETEYYLLVDIGPRWSKAKSIVRGLDLFPQEALPPDKDGYVIRVIFASADFTPRLTVKQLWLPRGTGRSFPMKNGEPGDEPGPISIHLRAPSVTDLNEPEELTALGRLYLLYENNLLQSAVLRAGVASVAGIKLAAPNELVVDFVLTGGFHELSRLAIRNVRLHSSDPESHHAIAANLAMNDDGAGRHRLLISRQADQAGPAAPKWIRFDAKGLEDTWNEIRRELRRSSYEYVGKYEIVDDEGEPVSALNAHNGKSREEFIKDLYALAKLGNKLRQVAFQQVVDGGPPEDLGPALKEAFRDAAIIQIARTSHANYVFPWSMIYDISLDDEDKHKVCDVVYEEWQEDGIRQKTENEVCPYADTLDHEKDIFCPYGFWGLKHVLEQPISNLQERNGGLTLGEPRGPVYYEGQINMAVGVTHELDLTKRDKHLENLFQLSQSPFDHAKLADTRKKIRDLLWAEQRHEIVYFLCHGEYDQNDGPFLGVGYHQEGAAKHRIYSKNIGDWWLDGLYLGHPPQGGSLIFINACGSARLGPGEVLNFVTVFGRVGASGVIGTEIGITLPMAAEVGEYLLNQFYMSVPVGQAMREMRWRLANKGNLLGLAYTAYCQSDLHIVKEPNQP